MMSGERNTKPIYVFTYGKEMENSCNTHAMQCVYKYKYLYTYYIHYILITCYYTLHTHIHNDRTLYENSICYSSCKKWMEHVVL